MHVKRYKRYLSHNFEDNEAGDGGWKINVRLEGGIWLPLVRYIWSERAKCICSPCPASLCICVPRTSVFVCAGHLYLCARDICICCKQAQARPTLIQRPVTLSGFHTFTSRRICTQAKYVSHFFILCLDLLFFIGFYENVEKRMKRSFNLDS